MKTLRVVVLCTIAAASVAISTPAAAQSGQTFDEKIVEGNQVVKFGDDILASDPNGVYGQRILVRPGATRIPLIRPRMNFVMELVKSVENL
jgi:hypothetical protein